MIIQMFYGTGGDDGPVAREMNRMITILKSDAEKLEKLTEQCKTKTSRD